MTEMALPVVAGLEPATFDRAERPQAEAHDTRRGDGTARAPMKGGGRASNPRMAKWMVVHGREEEFLGL
jgi:hypothetical protein